jgi:cytochrome bd-type quinol oxidase subunit 2
MPEANLQHDESTSSRRWTVIGSGLLIGALALVVIYTNRRAFFSPLAVVVISAIGLAAVLLQVLFRRDLAARVHSPLWLNVLGILFAIAALFADSFRLSPQLSELMALGAIGSFGISSVVILTAIRKHRAVSK